MSAAKAADHFGADSVVIWEGVGSTFSFVSFCVFPCFVRACNACTQMWEASTTYGSLDKRDSNIASYAEYGHDTHDRQTKLRQPEICIVILKITEGSQDKVANPSYPCTTKLMRDVMLDLQTTKDIPQQRRLHRTAKLETSLEGAIALALICRPRVQGRGAVGVGSPAPGWSWWRGGPGPIWALGPYLGYGPKAHGPFIWEC